MTTRRDFLAILIGTAAGLALRPAAAANTPAIEPLVLSRQ